MAKTIFLSLKITCLAVQVLAANTSLHTVVDLPYKNGGIHNYTAFPHSLSPAFLRHFETGNQLFTPFGFSVTTSLEKDSKNSGNQVFRIKGRDFFTDGGSLELGTRTPVDLTTGSLITMPVYALDTDIEAGLQFSEDKSNNALTFIGRVTTTSEWRELRFDFTRQTRKAFNEVDDLKRRMQDPISLLVDFENSILTGNFSIANKDINTTVIANPGRDGSSISLPDTTLPSSTKTIPKVTTTTTEADADTTSYYDTTYYADTTGYYDTTYYADTTSYYDTTYYADTTSYYDTSYYADTTSYYDTSYYADTTSFYDTTYYADTTSYYDTTYYADTTSYYDTTYYADTTSYYDTTYYADTTSYYDTTYYADTTSYYDTTYYADTTSYYDTTYYADTTSYYDTTYYYADTTSYYDTTYYANTTSYYDTTFYADTTSYYDTTFYADTTSYYDTTYYADTTSYYDTTYYADSTSVEITSRDSSTTRTGGNKVVFTVKNALGLADELSFISYPNPVTDVFTLQLADGKALGDYTLFVMSASGRSREVKITQEGNSIQVDVRPLASGLYFIRLRHEKEEFILRFVKR